MSALYNIARRGFLTEVTVGAFIGQINWEADDFRVALVSAGYAFNEENTSMDNVDPGDIIQDEGLVNTGSLPSGIATADSTVFPTVTGDPAIAVIIYRDNGTAEPLDNALIAYLDDAITGLPVTPNGGDITILWGGGNDQIFRL